MCSIFTFHVTIFSAEAQPYLVGVPTYLYHISCHIKCQSNCQSSCQSNCQRRCQSNCHAYRYNIIYIHTGIYIYTCNYLLCGVECSLSSDT